MHIGPRVLTACALTLVVVLAACTPPPGFLPDPALTISAERSIDGEPVELARVSVPGRSSVYVQVDVPSPGAAGPHLLFVEVSSSAVQLELRTMRNRLIVASRSPERFGAAVSQLASSSAGHEDQGEVGRSSVSVPWSCLGPCVAVRHETTSYLVKVENPSSSARSVGLFAYALPMTDGNEPNDSAASATRVDLVSDGSGASGAIEYVGDVDFFRLVCSSGFGPAARLEFSSPFTGAIALRADGRTYAPGQTTDPIACGSVISVAVLDSSAGPSASSRYSFVAEPAALFDLEITAQANTTNPTPRGSVTLAPDEVARVRVSFPSSGADLRFVELGGANVDGSVRLEVRRDSGSLVGASVSATLFADSVARARAAAVSADETVVAPASVFVGWQCLGPCVAAPYDRDEYIVSIVNTARTSRTVQVLAYGTAASDRNEPNDAFAAATEVTIASRGDGVTGAIEVIGDVDYYRLECAASFPFDDVRVELESSFRGSLGMRRSGSATVYEVGDSITVSCGSVVRVFSLDGTAGPGAASRYSLLFD